jgi:phage-related protein
MSSSIYNIQDWSSSAAYKVFDIYTLNGKYYYVVKEHSNIHPDTALFQGYVDGLGSDGSGRQKARFFWTPSYSSNANFNPRIKSVKLGDGYEVRNADGINNTLLEFELSFDNRSLDEYTSIMHFLVNQEGHKAFIYTPLIPYNKQKLFVCRSWSGRSNFYENYSVTCKFEETVN